MAFIRQRIIKNNTYWYLEFRWREDGKVRSKSTLIGKGGGGTSALQWLPHAIKKEDRGWKYIEEWMAKNEGAVAGLPIVERARKLTPEEKLKADGEKHQAEKERAKAANEKLGTHFAGMGLSMDLSPTPASGVAPVEKAPTAASSPQSPASEQTSSHQAQTEQEDGGQQGTEPSTQGQSGSTC